MWELDCEESWALKNWCFWTVVLEKTLERPLDCNEIQPVHFERDQPWDFFGRNDAKAETPVLWPPHAKNWLIGKESDAERDWGQEEKGTTEDEMAGWHHRLDGREFEWTPGDGDGPGGLMDCDSRGRKKSDMTERLNWLIRDLTSPTPRSFQCSQSPFSKRLRQSQSSTRLRKRLSTLQCAPGWSYGTCGFHGSAQTLQRHLLVFPCDSFCVTFLQRLIPYLGAPFSVAESWKRRNLVGIPVLCTSGELLNSSLESLLGSIPATLMRWVTPGWESSIGAPERLT